VAGDQPIAESAHRAHHRFRAIAGHRVGGEGHAGGIGRHHPLDQDRHGRMPAVRAPAFVHLDAFGGCRRAAATHGRAQGVEVLHAEHRLVMARIGCICEVFGDGG
jgi:hypothetical protein